MKRSDASHRMEIIKYIDTMKIGVFISELLYKHDEVILPGLGRFFTKYVPAKFIPEEGKVLAPSKTIAFDSMRKEGNTPLIGFLAGKHDMEVGQVSAYLEHFVGELAHLVESGKKVELERVGVFSKDASGSLVFEPDRSVNYLNIPTGEVPEPPRREGATDVFAVWPPAVSAEPGVTETGVPEPEKTEPVAVDEPEEGSSPDSQEEPWGVEPVEAEPAADEPEEGSSPDSQEKPWWVVPEKTGPAGDEPEDVSPPATREEPWWAEPEKAEPAAEQAESYPEEKPVTGFKPVEPMPAKEQTAYVPAETVMEKERKPELPKALKWLAFTIVPLLIILIILALNFNYVLGLFKRERAQPAPAAIEQRDPVAVQEADAVVPAEEDVAAAAPAPAAAAPAPAAPAVQPPAPVPGQTMYFIVVGSFPDEASAESLAQSLRDRGAAMASVFMRTPNNYHRVCYGYYNSLDEAERVLAGVKADINPDAWILHR